MATEIERKYLVLNKKFKADAYKVITIKQGFLNSNPHRTVRIRITDKSGLITVKGMGSADGTTRFEWEKEIDLPEANELLVLCEPTIIEKKRYLVKTDTHIIEVDEFYGANSGLTVAEIELSELHERIDKPEWLGKEITGIPKYYNAMLSKNPFITWKDKN
ncbi:MAG: adenylate cyclase [Flavobacteriales bacterium]|nr:MAG: adenylate cyclase [Flavobacteriales bacterium]